MDYYFLPLFYKCWDRVLKLTIEKEAAYCHCVAPVAGCHGRLSAMHINDGYFPPFQGSARNDVTP